jgi:hypothetical protein
MGYRCLGQSLSWTYQKIGTLRCRPQNHSHGPSLTRYTRLWLSTVVGLPSLGRCLCLSLLPSSRHSFIITDASPDLIMVYFDERHVDGSRTPGEGSSTPKDGARTPRSGARTPSTQTIRHPSAVLFDQMPPPTPGQYWGSGSRTPVTGNTTVAVSRRSSFQSMRSMRSMASTSYLDDVKHEIMANFLFQQQCTKLWIGDASGELEGILLRKSKGNYITCPPSLVQSSLGFYCSQLNFQASE